MHEGLAVGYRNLLPGYGTENASYRPRHALLRLKDGRLLSGSGGDLEVLHPLELERSQHTGMPVRVTVVELFGGGDTVRGMQQLENSDHVLVYGSQQVALVHGAELFEGTVVAMERILSLPSNILSVNVEKHAKTELLLTFLLESGLFHYSLSLDDGHKYECLLCFKCTRPIQSGVLWRDGGALHVAYYDGYIRVGVANEDYHDMLLVKRISSSRHSLSALMEILCDEVTRLTTFEENDKGTRTEMLERIRTLKDTAPPTSTNNPSSTEDDELSAAYVEFVDLKMSFRNHSIRADRISHRLVTLRQLLSLVLSAIETANNIDTTIEAMEKELQELKEVGRLHDECVSRNSRQLIEKSRGVLEERKYTVEELLRKTRTEEMAAVIENWDEKISVIIAALSGFSEAPKDMRSLLCHSIFEHRPERTDRFSHFLLDHNARDLTLYCMSGLSTLAIYPRKCLRVASISLDQSYSTSLTSVCLMTSLEGVYVADAKGVFPIFFYRDKRYFDAGNPIALPAFDSITCILKENDGLIVGSLTGGLLHLAFDPANKYEHLTIASCLMAHPFSHGPILSLRVIGAGDCHLAIHTSPMEVAISERDNGVGSLYVRRSGCRVNSNFYRNRWHRVTCHTGGAHCLSSTEFAMEHRGAFLVVGSTHYARIKALQYTEDNLVGLHDMGESRAFDEGKPIEVLSVSLDPSMEFRPLPCKLRYAVGYADKAIRTYVALLTGEHEFNVSEKFIAQIEPLHCVSQMICFHGRPMGCYASHSKTLQVWNDLDRHQQKKMKSERMELHKMDSAIVSLTRVEGRSSYLLVFFRDSRLEIHEERGRGTGKLEKAGSMTTVEGGGVIRVRVASTSCGDRLFIHILSKDNIHVYTVLVEAGKMVQDLHILSSPVSLHSATSMELMPHKPYEFVVFGEGIEVHRLSEEERRLVDKFRDFEF